MGKNVAVFVDVANIFYAAKAAGVDVAQLRVDVAVVRGLLLDWLITGDGKGTDAAFAAYLRMRTS